METLLTVREVATALRVSRHVARALLNTGALPSVPFPGSAAGKPHRRVRSSDLDAYIAGRPMPERDLAPPPVRVESAAHANSVAAEALGRAVASIDAVLVPDLDPAIRDALESVARDIVGAIGALGE